MNDGARRVCTAVFLWSVLFWTSFAHAYQHVRVDGYQLVTDYDQDGTYTPFFVKGVGYNAIPTGAFPSEYGICWYLGIVNGKPQFECPGIKEYEDPAILDRDLPVIKAMNANTIRTWGKVTPQLMDKAQALGLKVIAGYWLGHNLDFDKGDLSGVEKDFLQYVQTFKDHPALLMWVVGYENESDLCNFQGAKTDCSRAEQSRAYYDFVNSLARQTKMLEGDSFHPVMMISVDLGDIGQIATDERLKDVDIHGCNVYRGPDFSNFFELYANRSAKPLLISEFGADAWFVLDGKQPEKGVERQDLQASFLAEEWDTLLKHTGGHGGFVLGGVVSPFADSWWQYKGEWSPSCATHDHYYVIGFYSGPDGFTNPEWFGLSALKPPSEGKKYDWLKPRLAYTVMQQKFADRPPVRPWQGFGKGSLRTDISWNYTAGYHFTPLQAGQITQLGGLFNGTKTVYLWNKTMGVLLAQTQVTSKNAWSYSDIVPVDVIPSYTYTVAVALDGSGGSHAYDIPSLPLTCGDIRIEGSTFAYGNSRPVSTVSQQMYGQVDINFVPRQAGDNHAPVFLSGPMISPRSVPENNKGTLSVKAKDEDGDTLIYRWLTSSGTIQGDGPQVTYIPPEVSEKTWENVVCLISDGQGGIVYGNILFEVVPVSDKSMSPERIKP